jgi:DNA invertase Pin-like site-specific DNA recombinase
VKLLAYIRVSDVTEDPGNQRFGIYEWAARSGHQIVDVYEDVGVSGARSLSELVDVFKTVEARGKVILSVRESWLWGLDPTIRKLIVAVLGWAAEMEQQFIRERTKLALARLKARGVRLGRPRKVTEATALEAIKYVERGYTLRDAAKLLGVGYTTLARFIHSTPMLRARYYEAKARARARRR